MRRIFFATLLSLGVFFGVAQTPKKIREFSPGKIEGASVDRLGNLFLIFTSGSIKKYDANGHVLASLKTTQAPSLLEPWYHPKIFSYWTIGQRYVFYDHNFNPEQEQKVDPAVAIEPFLVCPTNDNKLLVLDKADLSLKKVNPNNDRVLSEFNIDTAAIGTRRDFTYMREYQNLIFFLDKKTGIFIFSNLGKKINEIKYPTQNFGFYGVQLFYLAKDKIVFFDLYTEKTREVALEAGKFVIVTDERIFLIKENDHVIIYEYIIRPEQK